MELQKQLEKVKTVFSSFASLSRRISVLQDSYANNLHRDVVDKGRVERPDSTMSCDLNVLSDKSKIVMKICARNDSTMSTIIGDKYESCIGNQCNVRLDTNCINDVQIMDDNHLLSMREPISTCGTDSTNNTGVGYNYDTDCMNDVHLMDYNHLLPIIEPTSTCDTASTNNTGVGYNYVRLDIDCMNDVQIMGDDHLLPIIKPTSTCDTASTNNTGVGYNYVRLDTDCMNDVQIMGGDHLLFPESSTPACDIGLNSAGFNYTTILNQDFNGSQTHDNEQVMGVNIPKNSSFNEKRFEHLLCKRQTDTANFIYYLHEDYDETNALNAPDDETEIDVTSVFDQTIQSSGFAAQQHLDESRWCQQQANNTMNSIESEQMFCEPFGSNDITTGLDVGVADDITERADDEIGDKDLQSTSEHEANIPWKIVIEPSQGCDDTNMFVPSSGSGVKKLCCTYCLNRFTKLARHLKTAHKDKANVERFCSLPAGSKERKNIIAMIRKEGQFKWNGDAKLNGGELQTCRRPNKKFQRTAADFDSCPRCFEKLSGKTLSKHFKKCSNNALQCERKVKELSRKTEGRFHPDACSDLRVKIFPKMRANSTMQLIRFDWLIVEFGNGLCLNYFPIYQQKLIRSKLQSAGKLLVASKSISSEVTDFASLFHVKRCNVVIEAIRKVTKFDFGAKRFGSPGTATTLVTLVKAIGELLVVEYLKQDDVQQEKNVERFLKVFTKEAKLKINKLAAFTQKDAKRSKKVDIPSTEDVKRFATYLDYERDKLFAELSQGFSYEKWQALSELTIAAILVFNRRRVGDMMNILVREFNIREMIASYHDKLVPGALPDYISQIIKSRMIVRGKLGKDVPILLKHGMDECIQLLLRHRKDARIGNDNEFLFALYSPIGDCITVEACAVIRTHASRCSAQNPGSLRGTKLRKHMASICGTMNLTDQAVSDVAKYMGHDNQIHRDIYRHNTLQREVVQMTSILEAAQGRSLGNINDTISPDESRNEQMTASNKKVQKKHRTRPAKNKIQRARKQTSTVQNQRRKTSSTTVKPTQKEPNIESDEDSESSTDEEWELARVLESALEEAANANIQKIQSKAKPVTTRKQKSITETRKNCVDERMNTKIITAKAKPLPHRKKVVHSKANANVRKNCNVTERKQPKSRKTK